MRLPGRLQAAIEVLAEVEARHRPVAVALKDWGASHRFAGSGDRATIGNLVYDALRRRLGHTHAMGDASPRAMVLATVVRDWGVEVDDLAAQLRADGHGPGALSDEEMERLAAPPDPAAPPHVQADVPDWLMPSLVEVFGEEAVAEGAALARRPPLDLRVNTLKATRDKAAHALARIGAAPSPLSPVGLRVPPEEGARRHPSLVGEDWFERGRVEVQDEGSQIAALMAGAAPGEQVLDLCAGAGGKTLALAATMENRGQIFATDRDRKRLAPLFARAQKAGIRDMQVIGFEDRDRLAGRMDLVVVDAPCSGSGTWRRRPDIKWRLAPDALARRVADQDGALDDAAPAVRPGGRLCFITCSLLPEENDRRVEAFLSRHPGFTADDAPARFRAVTGTDRARRTSLGVQMSPAATDTDAFYVALLRRGE